MKADKNSKWTTYDGRVVTIGTMEDTHLANVIKHIHRYMGDDHPYLPAMYQEAKDRGLTPEFLERAYIPFKDPEGNWMLWDSQERAPKKVG